MAQNYANVKRKVHKNENMSDGNLNCLACGQHLAYCGKPFSAVLACPKCGAANVYCESQQPSRLQSPGQALAQQHSD